MSKPALMPPGWVFGTAWSVLYILIGQRARRSDTLFLIQLALNLAWSPLFFAIHRIMFALGLLIAIAFWASCTAMAFWRIRALAGMLLLPYLVWLAFVGILNRQIHQLNPVAAVIQLGGGTTIVIQ